MLHAKGNMFFIFFGQGGNACGVVAVAAFFLNTRTWEIDHDRNVATVLFFECANCGDLFNTSFELGPREIKTSNVHLVADHGVENIGVSRSGAYGCNNLCVRIFHAGTCDSV